MVEALRPDFDRLIELSGTDSERWSRYAGQDVIPLWVADMDFAAPACVIEALERRVRQGVFGYSAVPEALREAVVRYLAGTHDWTVDPDWIVFLPGVVPALHTAVRHLTRPDEHVLVPQPIYHHFRKAPEMAGRAYSAVPLVARGGRAAWPVDALEAALRPNTRLLMFSNPHNPGGTVFRADELRALGRFCEAHDLWLVSDEIHADLVLDPDCRHRPLASLDRSFARRTVTLMSLNKAYNFPGCGLAWAIAEDPRLRAAIAADLHATTPGPGLFGAVATQAALEGGAQWHAALIEYLRGNARYVEQQVATLPGLAMPHLEATYLAWIDAGGLGLADPAALLLRHGVACSPGSQFGQPDHVRLNFAVPRSRLEAALDRIRHALA